MMKLFRLLKTRRFLCVFNIHDWTIYKWTKFKDRKCKSILKEGFNRTCESCHKEQELKRPTKYHPTKYVWSDLKSTNQ